MIFVVDYSDNLPVPTTVKTLIELYIFNKEYISLKFKRSKPLPSLILDFGCFPGENKFRMMVKSRLVDETWLGVSGCCRWGGT